MTDKTIQNSTWGGPIKLVDLEDGTYGIAVDVRNADEIGGGTVGAVSLLDDAEGNPVNSGNPLPVAAADVVAALASVAGTVAIDQATDGTTNRVQARNASHDDLNVNANLQVNDADNAVGNPAFVQLTGAAAADITFHDAAVAAADGAVLTVGGCKALTVEIYGTSTSRTVAFIGRGPAGADRAIMGVRLSDLSTATSTTGTGELWQFDVTGLMSVLMDLQAVSGGNVSVKGRAVA
jgi:hypothetical protein